jgi:serine/threonine-protein kinase
MAEVFAGSALGSHGFEKPVAIKRLLPELAHDAVFVERLIGEAKLVVGLQHGNLVSVLDLAREADDVFLVMDLVDGPSLRQLLRAHHPRVLPLAIATYVVQAAAAGLEFAHARPGGAVIHADISPSNVLLTSSGEVRVADFGIARREGRISAIVEGKWAYMAPEQARGEALTPRSDVFALGVVLYELIAGVHPIGHKVTHDVRELQEVQVCPPRLVQPSVPADLDALVLRMLANDPAARPARMQDVIDALGDVRFASGWRDGASELAQLIRAAGVGAAFEQPTARTEVPATIATRSLIVEAVAVLPTMPVRQRRYALGVLGGAAALGTIAAIAIASPAEPVVVAAPAPRPIVTPLPDPEVPAPAPVPAPAAAPVEKIEVKPLVRKARSAPIEKKLEEAQLKVNTLDGTWAYVRIGSERLQTPGARFKLAPGTYVVRLENDIDPPRTCSVRIGAGQARTLTVEMEEGSCAVR